MIFGIATKRQESRNDDTDVHNLHLEPYDDQANVPINSTSSDSLDLTLELAEHRNLTIYLRAEHIFLRMTTELSKSIYTLPHFALFSRVEVRII